MTNTRRKEIKERTISVLEYFLEEIIPVLRGLTRSHREENWKLHLSAVRRSLSLFFAFDRTNYCRWVPLYYEDCIALEKNFPAIYASFVQGGFVVRQTLKCGSGVPMDQALGKEYDKPAKGQGGIICISRRKEAVAQWNIIKHEKSKFTKHLRELCCLNKDNEYTVHHEFSQTLTEGDEEYVEQIVTYTAERNNPFDTSITTKVTNIVTGKEVNKETSSFFINCIKKGEENYKEFRQARLIDKTEKIMDPTTKVLKIRKHSEPKKKIDIKKETIMAIRNIDYARLRNYSISDLLCYELTSASFFLTQDDGYLRKSEKSELTRQIEKKLETPPSLDVPKFNTPSMVAIDFMAYARKIPVAKLKLKTFGKFVMHLWQTVCFLSKNCSRMDIISDLYLDQSMKEYKLNRQNKSDGIVTAIDRMDQPLRIEMDRFWPSTENKVRLQQFFVKWLSETYKDRKPEYLRGSHVDNLSACLRVFEGHESLLKCDHEEADDLMFHINHAVIIDQFQKVIVASADTDVFICLMYHFRHWSMYELEERWVIKGQGNSSRAVPVCRCLASSAYSKWL